MLDDLPSELIEKFFFKLPIADVVRFTSVCKSWYKLITSIYFKTLYLNSSIANTESRIILRLRKEYDHTIRRYYLHRDNQAFEQIDELQPPINPIVEISICGSSNGVFCCSYDERIGTGYNQRLILRKSMFLPKSRDRVAGSFRQYNVGFGFLPSSNNFKIVRVVYTEYSDGECIVPSEVEIYESCKGSWRELDDSGLSYALEIDCGHGHALRKGVVHWPACDPHCVKGSSIYGGLIVSFDLTSEKFGTLLLPDCVRYDEKANHLCLFTVKEYLCLMHCDEQSIVFKMKEYGVIESWEKLFSFETFGRDMLCIRENGEMLMAELIDEDDEEDEEFSLVSCDPKTNEMMDLGVHEDALYFYGAYPYVDSLFLI